MAQPELFVALTVCAVAEDVGDVDPRPVQVQNAEPGKRRMRSEWPEQPGQQGPDDREAGAARAPEAPWQRQQRNRRRVHWWSV